MNNFVPDKPFKTYKEQLNLLESRGLIIEDENLAIHFLQTYSYYDLVNGNLDALMLTRHPDKFIANTNFADLVQIRIIEDRLKNTFLKQILMIEKTFKTVLSYYIASTFGVDSRDGGYLSLSNYSQTGASQKVAHKNMKRLKAIRDDNVPHPQGDPINHYREDHNHIPPWILVDELTLGETIYWFKSLNHNGQENIAKQLFSLENLYPTSTSQTLFVESIDVMREFRNYFAHNSVLSQMFSHRELDFGLLQQNLNTNILTDNEFASTRRNGLYACYISVLLLSNDFDQTSIFIAELQQSLDLLEPSKRTFFIQEVFGLPSDFIDKGTALIHELHQEWGE
ncbi:Abi family protein [Lactiplantibacillus songbeiensis]|uniref:Abi family protein n=1 Tax=Lactiplantibacillus songbeiensis TaxID=2559920 RepID=A0ABW4C4Y1_9LACO|nr:Abi family protein [Lactiplantibacillus songbeiensis]